MKVLILIYSFICTTYSFQSAEPVIQPSDIKNLTGQKWIGQLTYLDYSSNKKTSIAANLLVSQSKTDKYVWYFHNLYPKEPHANNSDTVILSRDGKMINRERVKERSRINKGTVQIITEENHLNEGKEMVYRHTYTIGKTRFSIKKEERGINDTLFIERNTYNYHR